MLKIFCDFQNSLPEEILTVSDYCECIYKEKASSFIAQIFRVDSSEHFNNILSKVRKKYFDASHYCFAYSLIEGKIKYSDDGEPPGTAGIRIFNVITHHKLSNVAIIVVIYFGWTKLGVGPLGKAYFTAASMIMEKVKTVKLYLCQLVDVKINFSQISYLYQMIKTYNLIIEESKFSSIAYFKILIRINLVDKFIADFQNTFLFNSEIIVTRKFFYVQL